MKFEELSNEEIIFIHLLTDEMLNAYKEVIEKGGMTYDLDSPIGEVELFKEFTEEELETIKTSKKVALLKSITDKFGPLTELIGDSDEEIIAEVREALFPSEIDEEQED